MRSWPANVLTPIVCRSAGRLVNMAGPMQPSAPGAAVEPAQVRRQVWRNPVCLGGKAEMHGEVQRIEIEEAFATSKRADNFRPALHRRAYSRCPAPHKRSIVHGHHRSQQPWQMTSLRSTAASSAVRCSSSPRLCDGTSPTCGWRWPTGAPSTDRAFCANDNGPTTVEEDPANDPAGAAVWAKAPRPPRKANIATILVNFRITVSP